MCGIFGITAFQSKDLGRARESLHKMGHRGPDQWNDYFEGDIYLGHRRLSILDLSENGRQPMISADGSVVICVNGEVYNYLELKSELRDKYPFKSTSDSEVILYGFVEWGIDKLLEKIDGMYALSIYDKTENKLYLVRDRVGIKPLFYSRIDNRFVFASELKSIENFYTLDSLSKDYTALYDFLTYKYIPAPKTMYKDVYKLEPGHYLVISLEDQSVKDVHYWQLSVKSNSDGIDIAKKKITSLVKKSVDEQMMSDVPVGFFLSGGLDSSSVVAMAAEAGHNVNTFSIGFSDKSHDETHYADLVAKQFQTIHRKKILDEDKTIELTENLKSWYDEPFADFSCFPTFLVSEFAREYATVVLTGDGGDEVFGGYNWYQYFKNKSKFRFPSLTFFRAILKPFISQKSFFGKVSRKIERPFLLTDLELYAKLMGGLLHDDKEEFRQNWGIPDNYDDYWYYRKYYRMDLDLMTRLQYLDFHTFLPDDILTKVDRVSMQVSLECRVPLLSKEIIEYVFSLKPEVRFYNNELKGALKEALRPVLPKEILEREKKGFSIPFHRWRGSIFGNAKSRQEYVLSEIFNIKS